MARRSRGVEAALNRWVAKGLLTPDQADGLRREEEMEHAESARRWGQILIASLGAMALILAGILFAERSWEYLTETWRTVLVVTAGLAVYAAGLRVFERVAWRYSGVLLQTGGLGLVLAGLVYSYNAWPEGSVAGVLTGLVALAVPVALAPLSFREGVLMSAVHTALAFGYLAVFFNRTVGLEFDAVVWALDGVALASVGVFWVAVRRWPGEYMDRALVAFAVSMWAGLVLAMFTGVGPLDWEEHAVWAMDVWLLLIVALTLWGIHHSPSEYRRDAYETNLALSVAVGGLLAMFSAGEALDLDAEGASVAAALVGILGLGYGLRFRSHQVLLVGALVVLVATWIFAIDQAGATGGVVALLLSAGVLFWVSTRIRASEAREPGAG